MKDSEFLDTVNKVHRLMIETFSQPNLIKGDEFMKLWKKNAHIIKKSIAGTSNGVPTVEDAQTVLCFYNHYAMMCHLNKYTNINHQEVEKPSRPLLRVVH